MCSLVKAIEAVRLAPRNQGGAWIEDKYRRLLQEGLTPDDLPVNTHGGLMCFGAPWEAPAMYSIVEALAQLNGRATGRQVTDVKTALVYGNGGVFSSSSVAVFSVE